MDKNKELCGLLGICWHEKKKESVYVTNLYGEKEMCCRKCGKWIKIKQVPTKDGTGIRYDLIIPSFTSPEGIVQLLRAMKTRKDYEEFGELNLIFCCWSDEKKDFAIPVHYVDSEDGRRKFVNLTIDFLKGKT